MEKEYDVEVEWKAFELRPDTPPDGTERPFKPDESNELRSPMKEAAEAAGLDKMRRQSFVPNCRPPLQAAEYAKDNGKFDEYHKAAFIAYWEDGRNIGKPDVLKEVLDECGLDGEEFISAGNNGQYAQRVEAQLAESHMYGISGVPAFILDNKYLISGAQPYEVFQQVMEQIQKDKRLKGLWVPGQAV